jgi:ABC-type protease/lipase transport system fused ATPase/permease subunit
MKWLFVPQLRPFVLLAGAASLVLNVALLGPALYMLQVFDRVFSSRSVETLAMLSALGVLALALGYCMDAARSRALAWAGRALDRHLSPAALASSLRDAARTAGKAESDSLRDIAQLRNFLGGSGIHALFDAPWLPVYLLVIFMMHPVLGWTAAIGACLLAGLGVLTERLTHEHAERALQRARGASRHAEALTRNAEVIVGMGMTRAAVDAWRTRQEDVLQAQTGLVGRTARLAALARALRQALQVATLGIGAWLVIGDHASEGIMVAATILLGRALQPAEHLISGWKSHVEARGAWTRLRGRPLAQAADPKLELPAPSGRLELERVVFGPLRGRPPIVKGVTLALEAGESLGIVGPSGSARPR